MQNEKIAQIKSWLGTGSVIIFGLPFSGKETVGRNLALALGAVFISGGEIIRHAGRQISRNSIRISNNGDLLPIEDFERLILPYLNNDTYRGYPLVLDSVGRQLSEEQSTIDAAAAGGHKIMAAILLNVSENEARERWKVSRIAKDREAHFDDRNEKYLDERFSAFREKTEPVIASYHRDRILISVNGHQDRAQVMNEAIDKLYDFSINS
jgi:Adenylate kinase and related kinases